MRADSIQRWQALARRVLFRNALEADQPWDAYALGVSRKLTRRVSA
jgi:hypothetical protein